MLKAELGLEHTLASRRLYTDGAEILHDYAIKVDESQLVGLTIVRTRQRVFAPVIQDYLKRITYAQDGWARHLRLPVSKNVIVDLQRTQRLVAIACNLKQNAGSAPQESHGILRVNSP